MEVWFKKHQALIFYGCVSASIATYAVSATVFAYTNFSTKAEVTDKVISVKERLDLMDKRLERIENAIIGGNK